VTSGFVTSSNASFPGIIASIRKFPEINTYRNGFPNGV